MKFDIAITIDHEANSKVKDIVLIKELLKSYLKNKDYGSEVQEINIGFICVAMRMGYEKFHLKRTPRYVEHKLMKNKFTNESIELNKYFTYDIKLSGDQFNFFVACSDKEGQEFIAKEVLISLNNLNSLPKKVKDFDKDMLRKDLNLFLKEKGFIPSISSS
ncbi:hypothetical protein BH11BAC5_BH11BAC5_01640 [soil metagenome]